MKEKYTILNTESTREFCKDLIGNAFECIGKKDDFIILNTIDGELLFTEEEVKEINF